MISSRSGDQAPEQSLRTGSNMPFSPVYLLESVEATGSARPVQKELTGSPRSVRLALRADRLDAELHER
jgi:hypothetical protein